MALRKILTEGDEQLLKHSRKVEKFDDRLHTLIDDMRETLENSGGVGHGHTGDQEHNVADHDLVHMQAGYQRRPERNADADGQRRQQVKNQTVGAKRGEAAL